jgi:N utilization substance protein A
MQMLGLKREIDQVAKDKGIDSQEIISALEEAMKQAARRERGLESEIDARFNEELGEIELFEFREVVESVEDDTRQIAMADARAFDPDAELGDEIGVKIDTTSFGRILAQTAKQVIIQRIREAERDNVFEEYKDRQGEIVNGIVRSRARGGGTAAQGAGAAGELPPQRSPARLRDRGQQEHQGLTDRPVAHLHGDADQALRAGGPGDLRRHRDDPVGGARAGRALQDRRGVTRQRRRPCRCLRGHEGQPRAVSVVQELRGERIDIVPWSPDPARYVCSSLSPAQVSKVIIDDAAQSMDVIVPDDQLSLAIGRKGQNVRLAVQLTGWRIDIKSESKMRELAQWLAEAVSVVEGCGDADAELLLQQGVTSLDDLASCDAEMLTQIPGIDEAGAQAIKVRAAELAERKREEEEEAARLEAERAAEAAAAEAAAAEAASNAAEPEALAPEEDSPEGAG